ncbi:ABC transporter substrate-binding protein [Hyperthermus butylicus]|uniref:ABC-type dipeptide transport, periplasmic component n=1 Tax=Hyperthermus butylicus (strain DSM 5456 / JCM 9403 / PLM1-5) TaxID=415426 RepID=A2BKF7_HYPBU|nr:ABC-type dipeptide transport, periplasmic component [Hyperthermus butylicus DSM 5456]
MGVVASRAALIAGIVVLVVIVAGIAVYFASKPEEKPAAPTEQPTEQPTTTPTEEKPAEEQPVQAAKPQLPPEVKVIEVSKAVIAVAPKDVAVEDIVNAIDTKGKKLIIVRYEVDEENTKPVEESVGFSDINPAFYRNTTIDALIIAARKETNPEIREMLYEAVYKLSNYEVPILWLGQYMLVRSQWSWVHGRYYHPTLAERYDLLWEDPAAPVKNLEFGGYKNDPSTYVIATIGWPDTFDPAADYETFGWAIFHNIGDTLVTYWKDDTKEVIPDLAVAWVHDKEGTTWYFVIRGGVKAYDPWHNKVYDISAVDVLFTIWRVARLGLDPSWMVTEFIDVNNSKVLTEEEFDQILAQGGLYADYKGQTIEPKSLKELLEFFGYDGETAGVVMLKLYMPYSPILSILSDPFLIVIPMKYLFDNVDELKGKYEEALEASQYGKNPAAWANYIGTGEQEPTHLYLHKYPIGTGPYYVAEYKEDSYIVLKYNPYYWNKSLWYMEPYGKDGVPSHQTVIYLIANDHVTRLQIYKAGQADTAVVPLDRLDEVRDYKLQDNPQFKIEVETGGLEPAIVYIVLNANKEPFNNRLVRQALMYAIPFDQIKEVVYSGFLERLYGVIPAGFPGHNDDIVIKYTFDLDKAMELIQKSGIDPTKYNIEIWYNEGNAQREQIATLLQQTWGQLGFKVGVKALNWPTLLSKTEKGDFDVYIIGWAPDYLDPDNYAGPLFYGGTRFSFLEVVVPEQG